MPKNKTKSKIKKKNTRNNSGIAKIATLTTRSLSNAFVNFKKNQEIKKIKEITSSIVIESSKTYIKQKLDDKENINLISKSSNEIKSSIIK